VKKDVLFAVAAITALISSGPLCGQTELGTISGTARDSSGTVIPNVAVRVRNINTGVAVKTVTNAAGLYVVPNLLPGEHLVSGSRPGFRTVVRFGIVLNADERIRAKRGTSKVSDACIRKFPSIIYNALKNGWIFEDFPSLSLAEAKA
jgi:hypothetical protein